MEEEETWLSCVPYTSAPNPKPNSKSRPNYPGVFGSTFLKEINAPPKREQRLAQATQSEHYIIVHHVMLYIADPTHTGTEKSVSDANEPICKSRTDYPGVIGSTFLEEKNDHMKKGLLPSQAMQRESYTFVHNTTISISLTTHAYT